MKRIALIGLTLLLIPLGVYAQSQQYRYDRIQAQTNATATGNGTAVQVEGWGSIGVQISGMGSATVALEGTINGTNWDDLSCTDQKTLSTVQALVDTNTTVICPVGHLRAFRARISAYTSGTINVLVQRTTAVLGKSGGGVAGTLDQAFDGGKIIDGANSLANAVRIGDGVTPLCVYTDATLGPVIRPCTDSNTRTFIWTNFTWCLYDIEGSSCTLTVDPDATDNDKYVWAAGYRPIKTLSLPADALYPRGASTLVTDTALVSGGLISPYITTTDSDSDGFYRYLVMDPKWDGGTVTATVTVVNTNATPANAFLVHVSGACYPVGTAVPTTISTTGEQSATFTFGASGSCGVSACPQNAPVKATTAAITLNGTPAGGNYCAFQGQVDATGTTETVAGIKITQLDMHWKLAKGF